MFWKKKKEEPRDGRIEKREAIRAKEEAAEAILRKLERSPIERRVHNASFDGKDRRNDPLPA